MAKYISLPLLLAAMVAWACSSPGYKLPVKSPSGLHDSVLVEGLHYPWELVWGPDDHIWMTERNGRISRVNPTTGKVTKLLDVPGTVARGEGGLLGMALHPRFADTPHLFVACNYEGPKGYQEKIIRYTYNGTALVDPLVIFDNIEAAYIHNGCRLLILPDHTLLFSTGDASNQGLPQDKGSVNGKFLRIHLNGSIPADNPIPGSPVWSYGHRNAQGLVLANGILYSSEHGPDTDDEVNILEKGRNYGWPKVNGFCDKGGEKAFCRANNVQEPLYAWTPTIAVCGLGYYGDGPIVQWRHSLLMATLKDATLYQLQLDGSGKTIQKVDTYFSGKYGRLRDVCVAPNGKVYFCTSNGDKEDRLIVVSARE
jgi:aldose sugar dehydrogenase